MKHERKGLGTTEMVIVFVATCLIGAMGYLAYTKMIVSPDRYADVGMFATQAMPPLVRGVTGPNASPPDTYMQAPGLSEALRKIADENPCQPTEGRFKQIVLGVTADKTQALIGNSCGSTGVARTFMIKQEDRWVSIGTWKDSDHTDFSLLTDTPSCEVVEGNDIQRAIAPVCFALDEGTSGLFAGDMSRYKYVVR